MTDIKSNNDNICRICLESNNEKLKKRCNCINQCHDTCLIKWLKVRTESDYNYLKCEICNSPYKFDKNINKLLNKKNNKKYSILKLIILIFFLLTYFNFYLFIYNFCKSSFRDNKFRYFCCIILNINLFYTFFYTFLFFLYYLLPNLY